MKTFLAAVAVALLYGSLLFGLFVDHGQPHCSPGSVEALFTGDCAK